MFPLLKAEDILHEWNNKLDCFEMDNTNIEWLVDDLFETRMGASNIQKFMLSMEFIFPESIS